MRPAFYIISCVYIVFAFTKTGNASEVHSLENVSQYVSQHDSGSEPDDELTTLKEIEAHVGQSSSVDNRQRSNTSQLMIYMVLMVLCLLGIILIIGVIELITGKRKRVPLNTALVKDLIISLIISLPFYVGIFLFPRAVGNQSDEIPIDDYSVVMKWMMVLTSLGIALYFFFRVFQKQSQVRQSLPFVLTLSLLTGIANTCFIFLVVNCLHFEFNRMYLFYYFLLAMLVFVFSKKIAETKLIKLMLTIIHQYRIKLIDKILVSSYRDFEKIDRGRLMEILSGDTKRLGNAAGMIVAFLNFLISVVFAFIYLATISLSATGLTLLVIIVLASIYMVVSSKAEPYFEKARDSENTFMYFVNGMINGFKELSINSLKKQQYKAEFVNTCDEYLSAQSIANIKFINVNLFGNVLIMSLIGSLVFGLPLLMPAISPAGLIAYVMVILYIIGPVNAIVQMIPGILEIKVSWGRIQEFLSELKSPEQKTSITNSSDKIVHQFEVKDLTFHYSNNGENNFSVGPVNFRLEGGQTLFIVGGNGSGKTTLSMLLTGLYQPNQGSVKINGKDIAGASLGNYFSTVFSDFHLFNKIYGFDNEIDTKGGGILKTLQLTQKVKITGNAYNTIELSNGQRKRLALLQCFLEDKPVYLFDEWAADQDPIFRKYFYHELLPAMKRNGKIVIAITHDDHYFDQADIILKLDMGTQEFLKQPENIILN